MEYKHERRGCVRGMSRADREHNTRHAEAETQPPCRNHKQDSPPESLDGPERNERRSEVGQRRAAAQDEGQVTR